MTTRETISRWFDEGVEQGATHMIVACDTFDHQDYPVYISDADDVRKKEAELNGQSMTKVMEIYSMSVSKAEQLEMHRAFFRD